MVKNNAFKVVIVFVMAFLTGIMFVAVPALGTVFTNPKIFDLSQGQFGNLFLPQTGFIIVSALMTPFLVRRFGPKRILSSGMMLMIIAMLLLFLFKFLLGRAIEIFPLLLITVALIATGFGLTITTLNPLAASLFPQNEASAILILQFLLGVGTMTSPLLTGFFGNETHWFFIPSIIFLLLFIVLILFLPLKFQETKLFQLPSKIRIGKKLWWFIFAIIIYGFLEGTFGGFGSVLLERMGLDSSSAAYGLSLFWGGIALNRLLFGVGAKYLNLSKAFIILPLVVAVLLFFLPDIQIPWLLITFMFLIGFFMGSIFPGTIGWGTIEFPQYAVMVSGFILASDMVGTGVVTQILGGYSGAMTVVFRVLAAIALMIFVILAILSRKSRIKEAF